MNSNEPIDGIQTNGQIEPKVFRYILTIPNQEKIVVSVVSASATDAKEGLKKMIPPDSTMLYDGVSTKIVQV